MSSEGKASVSALNPNPGVKNMREKTRDRCLFSAVTHQSPDEKFYMMFWLLNQ